jgi:hypothetical protein
MSALESMVLASLISLPLAHYARLTDQVRSQSFRNLHHTCPHAPRWTRLTPVAVILPTAEAQTAWFCVSCLATNSGVTIRPRLHRHQAQ